MRAIVTGGSGFIGGKLAAALVAKGYGVKSLVRGSSNVDGLGKLGVELCRGDLSDCASLGELVKGGADVLYHIAAFVSDWGRREEFWKINVEATEKLLQAAVDAGVRRFVYISTSSVLWKSDFWSVHNMMNIDESYPYPPSYGDYYNETKAQAERAVNRFCREHGLETVIVRASGVWGAGDVVILPRIINIAKKNVAFRIGDGRGVVSPCHVDNLVCGLVLAAQTPKAAGNTYFINDGMTINHLEFIQKQLGAAGMSWTPTKSVPYRVAYALASALESVARLRKSDKPPFLTRFAAAAIAGSRTYSIERARQDLGYEPVVGLAEGLDKLAVWVRELGGADKLLRG
ncbi:MAG: NAD-dependent epimerase/dehydratase family protein [Deltaproteobacteria bacterium]